MSENKDNAKPVVGQTSDTINEMSADEFQRILFNYFEDHGIVSDLRAHLRRQMIDILNDTTVGRTVSQKQSSLSPRAQIINLLIAEFLMRNKYHFSLSVYSTEVPFLSILPEYSAFNIKNSSKDGETTATIFTEEHYWDILETLGFARDSIYSQKLHEYYFCKGNEPLLVCIIRLLSSICNIKKKSDPFKVINESVATLNIMSSNVESWLKDIYNLLIHFEIPEEIIQHLHDNLKILFEREQTRIKSEESTKFNVLQAKIEKDFHKREAEICRMINEMENTFYQEKQKLTAELNSEQEKIGTIQKTLKQKQIELEDRLLAVSRKEEVIKQREMEIVEQTDILESRIKSMQNTYEIINPFNVESGDNQQYNVKVTEQDVVETQSKMKLEYECLRKEFQETRETIQKLTETLSKEKISADNQIESEEKLLKGLLDRVQAENSQLRALNTQQQVRLDELSIRNSVLTTDLENSQTTINILSRNRQTNNTITIPPLTAPPSARTTRSAYNNYLNGGGETLGFIPQPATPPLYRNLLHTQSRDSRRKIARRFIVNNNSSNESQSPTDEILQEARHRLRKLEEETEAVDRSYRAFKQRHSKSLNDNVRHIMHQPTSRNFVAIPDHLRGMFLPRNSIAETTSPYNNLSFPSTSQNNFEPIPSTSRGVQSSQFHVHFNNNDKLENIEEEYSLRDDFRSPAGQSVASSSGILPSLHNLSISSVEISSDNTDANDNNSAPENKH